MSWAPQDASADDSVTARRSQVSHYSASNRTSISPPTLSSLPYEILEAILLNLPAQDPLLSQCLCRTFREMVASSTRIQRAVSLAVPLFRKAERVEAAEMEPLP